MASPGLALPTPLAAALAYGALGLPLAFAALPLYVHLPRLYGEFHAVPLALLGAVLLFARLADALIDPLLGLWSDRWRDRHPASARRQQVLLGALPFGLGIWLLFNPPAGAGIGWLIASLAVAYLGFSFVTICHQAWGAELARDDHDRRRLTAAREACGLAGVLLAAVLPGLFSPSLPTGLAATAASLLPLLALAVGLAWFGTRPLAAAGAPPVDRARAVPASLWLPLRDPAFRPLLAVFVLNGVAGALPATLFMFFVADVLRAEAWSGPLLALYFAAGLAALPFWVRRAARRGTLPAWREGMLLAGLAFAAAPWLGAGDTAAFALVCLLSGLALGADLVLPAAQLAEIARHRAATYFGVWNFAGKLNLALAAGLALPLLDLAGYRPGAPGADNNLAALALFYGALPLLGKAAALLLLHRYASRIAASPAAPLPTPGSSPCPPS